ncbi:MAG: hypothetical protein RL033_4881 [Pseudomonadota bacterium]|jgi:hypothetical protein
MSRDTRLHCIIPWLLPLLTCACGGELGSQVPSEETDGLGCSGTDCPVYPIRSGLGAEQPLAGGIGGEPFGSLCREDQVLVGIRALVADDLWGLGLNCGRLELSPSNTGYAVKVLPLDQLSPFGGNGINPAPPLVEYSCPPQMVVTAASWTLWQPFVEMQQVVKQMQLTCSELTIGADRQLRPGPTTALLIAGMLGTSDSPVLQSCEQGAVSGFTGRSGGAIDALSTSCVTLSIDLL